MAAKRVGRSQKLAKIYLPVLVELVTKDGTTGSNWKPEFRFSPGGAHFLYCKTAVLEQATGGLGGPNRHRAS